MTICNHRLDVKLYKNEWTRGQVTRCPYTQIQPLSVSENPHSHYIRDTHPLSALGLNLVMDRQILKQESRVTLVMCLIIVIHVWASLILFLDEHVMFDHSHRQASSQQGSTTTRMTAGQYHPAINMDIFHWQTEPPVSRGQLRITLSTPPGNSSDIDSKAVAQFLFGPMTELDTTGNDFNYDVFQMEIWI